MKLKKRTLKIIFIIIILLIIIFLINKSLNQDPYQFRNNKLFYSNNRGKINYELSLINTTEKLKIYYLNFQTKPFLNYETKIYGLLFMPKNKKEIPGLILLPGGGVTKESESILAKKISELGYAVFTFDQRGIGETAGTYLDLNQDYKVFSEGKEPIQHLSVFDALKAFDVLRKIKGIDKNNIAIAGESMGGRYAIIAAAIEKRIKGAIIISSSGFHIKKSEQFNNPYLLSVDPDEYIGDISPRKLFMLHGTNDTTTSLKDAQFTFNLAKEPKRFFIADNCSHGYCDNMFDEIKKDLKIMFEKQ